VNFFSLFWFSSGYAYHADLKSTIDSALSYRPTFYDSLYTLSIIIVFVYLFLALANKGFQIGV